MVNILRQKIGIYYKNREWGKKCFEHVVSQIPKEMVDRVINNKNEMTCILINGDIIMAVRACDGIRGRKFTGVIVQDEIKEKVLREIIYPCMQSSVFIIRDAEDVTTNYVAIKQELPRNC